MTEEPFEEANRTNFLALSKLLDAHFAYDKAFQHVSWRIIGRNPGMEAPELALTVAKECGASNRKFINPMRLLLDRTKDSLSREAESFKDSEWEERFEYLLKQKEVSINPQNFSYKTHNSHLDFLEYFAEGIKYLRCAGYFVRTELNEREQALRDQAAAQEKESIGIKAQLDLLEQLEAEGCLIKYLSCQLPDR